MNPIERSLKRGSKEQGFSLIEFMVAIALGAIITGGAISVYIAAKRSFTEVEQVAAVSENGRFALRLLGASMRHVGFFGGSQSSDIRQDGSLGSVSNDCTGDAAAYDLNNYFFVQNAGGASVFGCITDAVPGTDILVLKGVDPRPIYDADPDNPAAARDGALSFTQSVPTPPATINAPWSTRETYVVANSEAGILMDGADTAPSVGEGQEFALGAAWPYRFQIYYVRDGAVPTLAKKILVWDTASATMSVQTVDLVDGVENIQYRIGVDSDSDGEVDTFGNGAQVTAANAWGRVISMQVFVLVRSDAADPAYSNNKTYMLNGNAVTPGDNFRRVMLNSEIALRNPRLTLRGGA